MMSKTILIGGSHIEWGWLMQFIARARYKAKRYDRVIVACEEPLAYLFADFADTIETYPVRGHLKDRWLYNGKPALPPEKIRRKYPEAKLYYPDEHKCKNPKVKWYKYGHFSDERYLKKPLACLGDFFKILVHARNLKPTPWYDKKIVKGSRNWPIKRWVKLIEKLRETNIASIGSKSGARHVPGTVDLRGIALKPLCYFMANAKVLVGESSGPHHLAALCGCPSVVWTHRHLEKSLGGKTNRWRLEKCWNPFKTKVRVIDAYDWLAPVDAVRNETRRFL